MKAANWDSDITGRQDKGEESIFDVKGMMKRRWWVIALGGVVGFGLGYLHFKKQIPIFQSSARMLVVKEIVDSDLPLRGVGNYTESDPTAGLLIRSPLVVADAVKAFDLANLPPFVGRGDPTSSIIGGLGVTPVGGRGQVLDLTYRGTDPESCAAILKAVIQSYQTFLGKSHDNVNEETIRLITEAKDNLLNQLKEKEEDYRQFRQDSPLLSGREDERAQNIHQSRLVSIEGIRSDLVISRTKLQAQIQAIEAALERGENREALLLMTGRFAGRDSVKSDPTSPESQLFPLLLEEQMMMDSHGPDHPKLQSLRRRIELVRKFVTKSEVDDLESSDEERKPVEQQDFLQVYLDSLKQEIRTSEETERELTALFAQERESAKGLAVYEGKDSAFQSDIKRTQDLFDGVVSRLEEINLMKNYGGYKTEVISPPTHGWQVEPNRNRILTLAIVAGLFGGLVLSFLGELLDRTFRSTDDVSQHLGLPVIGQIPLIGRGAAPKGSLSRISEMIISFYHPKSRETEAFRAVRVALYFGAGGAKNKVVQVTSPNTGDGKSTLCVNLAVCIAQTNKSVLLIDADFRRPKIHKLFGKETGLGMSSVIRGDVELNDAIVSTEVPDLDLLPCGPRPDNPAELLTSHRFAELLDVLREKYDFVLIDTPPMLAVTDPGIVSARVDGVLLALRITKRTRSEATEATAMLRSLGANLIGVVINEVNPSAGYGAGFSRYAHRYGYGENAKVYFADEANKSAAISSHEPIVGARV